VGLEQTRSAHADETDTATLAPAVTDAGTYLPVSRKFEFAAALQRLTELAAAGGADGAGAQGRRSGLARLWRYPPAFSLAVVAASVIAYYIAYYY
jgi:hypothetical protein